MLIPAARRAWTGRHELELEVLGAVRRPHLERRVEGLACLAARGPRAPPRAAVAAAQQLGAELHDVLVRHGGARARDLPRVPERVHHVVAAGDDGEAAKDGGGCKRAGGASELASFPAAVSAGAALKVLFASAIERTAQSVYSRDSAAYARPR